jgi:YHS domain-containing protein
MTSHRKKEARMKMRTIIVLCLAVMVALSFGCSKKKSEAPKPLKSETGQPKRFKSGRPISMLDPVSKEPVDAKTSPYTYEYNNVLYVFSSAQNMETFKVDPEKYLAEMKNMQPVQPKKQ